MDTMKTSHAVLSILGIASLLLSGCDLMSTDSTSRNDSLDAQAGKDRFNNYKFLQGRLDSTGRVLDLAIVGNGLFILKNKDRYVYFRRPAAFIHDAEGYVSLGNVLTRLQGMKLYGDQDPYPVSEADSMAFGDPKPADLVDVRWTFNEVAPPRATSELRLSGNLDSDALGKGSVIHSRKFLHHAEASDLLIGLSDADGTDL